MRSASLCDSHVHDSVPQTTVLAHAKTHQNPAYTRAEELVSRHSVLKAQRGQTNPHSQTETMYKSTLATPVAPGTAKCPPDNRPKLCRQPRTPAVLVHSPRLVFG